jgi:hypothetical protein
VQLSQVGLTPAAIAALEPVEPPRLDPLLRAQRAQAMAAFRIANGEREAARAELSRVPRPVADPNWESAIAAVDALLLALGGEPAEAEARARDAVARVTMPTVLAQWQVALAHALAAQGMRVEATEVLKKTRDVLGARALAVVVRHGGPASPLAAALQAETEAPYR